jgi:hypothetical protein
VLGIIYLCTLLSWVLIFHLNDRASAFKIHMPMPYKQHDNNPNLLHLSMNFATRGTDVLSAWPGLPSTTTQIDKLQRLIGNEGYSAGNLKSYLVLFWILGNDHGYYLLQQRPLKV